MYGFSTTLDVPFDAAVEARPTERGEKNAMQATLVPADTALRHAKLLS